MEGIGITGITTFELVTLIGILVARKEIDDEHGITDNEIHNTIEKLLKMFDNILKEQTGVSFVEWHNNLKQRTDAQV